MKLKTNILQNENTAVKPHKTIEADSRLSLVNFLISSTSVIHQNLKF